MKYVRKLFETDAMERYRLPLWLVQELSEGKHYNIDEESILTNLRAEWQGWKRCYETLIRAASSASLINDEDKKIIQEMQGLAKKIREIQSDNSKQGVSELIGLYELADNAFTPERIYTLLDVLDAMIVLNETPVELPKVTG